LIRRLVFIPGVAIRGIIKGYIAPGRRVTQIFGRLVEEI